MTTQLTAYIAKVDTDDIFYELTRRFSPGPFDDHSFDVVFCSCAFCPFAGMEVTARQFWRVSHPGGRIGLSDLTLSGSYLVSWTT